MVHLLSCWLNIIFLIKKIFFIYLPLEGKGERERKRNIYMWLSLACPSLGTWPAAQALALTRNQTSDPLLLRPALNQSTEPHQPGVVDSSGVWKSECELEGLHPSWRLWGRIHFPAFSSFERSLWLGVLLPVFNTSRVAPSLPSDFCFHPHLSSFYLSLLIPPIRDHVITLEPSR